ncbi:MAG TPA: efflux RND transporter permease subunit [Planctomycetaceae bacterium]|nr:efflux RND transporter permease subunit [Planctomycetaceae bacterium]
MIERLIAFSIRRRAWVIGASALFALCGIWAVLHTPMDAVPDLSENQVLVYAEWPGHSPAQIDEHVTFPLSLELEGLPGVRSIRASSEVGFSLIHLIFQDRVSFESARRRVQDRLGQLETELPEGVAPRLAAEGIPTGQIFWYTVAGAGRDLAELRSIHDWSVAPRLRSVAGVAEVASVGGFVLEYHVELDPERLLALGISADQVMDTIRNANATPGGRVLQGATAEYVAQASELLSAESLDAPTARKEITDRLASLLLPLPDGRSLPLSEVARVVVASAPRRGVFEADGNEVVGGVVLMRVGENPLEVTRRLRERIREIQPGLPSGVQIIPCYDRTPLIEGAVGTVTRTLIEAMCVAALCVLVILRHFRASAVIALALPLAALGTFVIMAALRLAGIVDIQTNIMSLAGIAVSIGVLVDGSIVVVENVMFRLRARFGNNPVRGDLTPAITEACATVGRPVFFSILIMLVSFLPVFALGGIDGVMYRPLAFTKTFALLTAAGLAVTLVPALASVLIRGRLRSEEESGIVRSVVSVYRPILAWLLDRPMPLIWIVTSTLVLGAAPVGNRPLFLALLGAAVVVLGCVARDAGRAAFAICALVGVALVAEFAVRPLGTEMRLPLDEGMVMDMPITIPRASVTQSGDDLKARDMALCRFPEVAMVMGKAGRAETPFDPAPLDMIETMIEFRPREHWPRRRMQTSEARRHARRAWSELQAAKIVGPSDGANADEIFEEALKTATFRFDAVQREYCFHRNAELTTALQSLQKQLLASLLVDEMTASGALDRRPSAAEIAAAADRHSTEPHDFAHAPTVEHVELHATHLRAALQALAGEPRANAVPSSGSWSAAWKSVGNAVGISVPSEVDRFQRALEKQYRQQWTEHISKLNHELYARTPATWTRVIVAELLDRLPVIDSEVVRIRQQIAEARSKPPAPHAVGSGHHAGGMPGYTEFALIDPYPPLDRLQQHLAAELSRHVMLVAHDPESLAAFGGEMDLALQMPGWTNVWTKPIQNRVDMLSTGVNTDVGVRVMGRRLDDVVEASEAIAAVLREIPGAADVIADPVRGKGYLHVSPDPVRAAAAGARMDEVNELLALALGGRVVGHSLENRERHPIRVVLDPRWTGSADAIQQIPLPVHNGPTIDCIPLGTLATVETVDGPATVKSERGLIRNYVRMNVRERSPMAFVADARRVVTSRVQLPAGVHVEWTGQYEHTSATLQRMVYLAPIVVGLILLILYLTYHDWADACLMLLAVPGALAGGVLFQWLLGYKFSVAVGVGYIACFGMAASTGIVMLVYLRDSVARAGGLESLSLPELREAVLNGAVHRLRPKLLTEATTILGLAPMLWSTGVGAEVIRPMAAPVLGGILVADEVIDLLLPVLFYWVRRQRWLRLQQTADSAFSSESPESVSSPVCSVTASQS